MGSLTNPNAGIDSEDQSTASLNHNYQNPPLILEGLLVPLYEWCTVSKPIESDVEDINVSYLHLLHLMPRGITVFQVKLKLTSLFNMPYGTLTALRLLTSRLKPLVLFHCLPLMNGRRRLTIFLHFQILNLNIVFFFIYCICFIRKSRWIKIHWNLYFITLSK